MKTKQPLTTVLSLTILTSFLFWSCRPEEKEDLLGDIIYGHVVEEYTHNAIPYAYVGVVMEEWIDLFTYDHVVVDTIQADGNGNFQLDRNKYLNLANEHGAASFYTCADGPDVNGVDLYIPNCSTGGTAIYPGMSQNIQVEVGTVGWLQYLIIDTLPLNPEFTDISINALWNGGQGFGYPFGYDPSIGYIQEVDGYTNYNLVVDFHTWSDGINGNDTSKAYSIFSEGKDTISIFINY